MSHHNLMPLARNSGVSFKERRESSQGLITEYHIEAFNFVESKDSTALDSAELAYMRMNPRCRIETLIANADIVSSHDVRDDDDDDDVRSSLVIPEE